MKTKVHIISITALFITIVPVYSFIVSCRSLIHPESGNRILILGESHIPDTHSENNTKHIISGLEGLRHHVIEPVNCFIELGTHHIDNRECLSGITFKMLAEEIAQQRLEPIEFIGCDKRGRISDYTTALLILIHQNSVSIMTEHLNAKLKDGRPFATLRAFNKMVKRYQDYIGGQQIFFGEPISNTILEPLKRSIEDAHARLKKTVFKNEKETSDIYDILLKYLKKKCKGDLLSEQKLIKLFQSGGLWSDFVGSLDHAFAKAVFFCSVMQDQKSNHAPKLTLLIVEEKHAEKIAPMFYQMGYTLVEGKSCIPFTKKTEAKHKKDLTAIPNILHLLIYYAPLLLHPATEDIASQEYEENKTKLREIRTRVRTRSTATNVKHAIALIMLKEGTLTACNNPLCPNRKTATSVKKCSQCKIVSYCSAECQRSDWKMHKIVCKKE